MTATAINVAELTSRIIKQGKKKAKEKENERTNSLNENLKTIEYIEKDLFENARALVEIFKSLKENGLDCYGSKPNHKKYFYANCYIERLGFIEYSQEDIGIALLDGVRGRDFGISLVNGRLYMTDKCGTIENPTLTATELFSNPEKYYDGCPVRLANYAILIRSFAEMFEDFKNEYLEHTNSLLD